MKKTNFPHQILIYCLLVITTNVYAASNLDTQICSNIDFLRCMDINIDTCTSALAKAERDCMKQYPYISSRDNEELIATAKKYANCNKQHINANMGAVSGMFKQCIVQLQPTLDRHAQDKINRHSNSK